MTEYYNAIMIKILGPNLIMLFEDSSYFLQRTPENQQIAKIQKQMKVGYKNVFIIGASFGLATCLSIRRYFPNMFSSQINKIFFESNVILSSIIASTISKTFVDAKTIHKLKRQYIIGADQETYLYMRQFESKYKVSEENQVKYLLTEEQFSQWKSFRDNKKYKYANDLI